MNHIRIPHEGNAPDAGPSCHFLSTSWEVADPFDDAADPSFEPHCCIRIVRLNGCENRVEFGQRQSRIADLHVRRYLANTASTSASVAISPRATAASASSIAASSSGVAW